MELKEFITKALTDVILGVADAQKELKEAGSTGVVNATTSYGAHNPVDKATDPENRKPFDVEIDVAVIVESSSSNKKGGKFNLNVVAGGKENERELKDSMVSRVKFSVPVAYPY